MLGLRVGRMAGTRSTHPKLQIDPAFAQPHHSSPCETHSHPGTAYVGVASSPSVTTFIMSPYSSSSSLAALSVPQTPSEDSTCWNLIPYDIPWGSDYFAYKEGSLPGPEGDCLFLRSPTPVDKKRTVRACEKCRERKAKCSGDHPSCSRCIEKGRTCVYTSDSRRVKATAPVQPRPTRPKELDSSSGLRRRQQAVEHNSPASTTSSLAGFDVGPSQVFTLKQEHEDGMAPLSEDTHLANTNVSGQDVKYAGVMGDSSYYHSTPQPSVHSLEAYNGAGDPPNYQCVAGNGQLISLPPNYTNSLAPMIIAPKPVRGGPSPFPTMAAIRSAATARTYHTAAQFDGQAAIDPTTLGHSHAYAPFAEQVELFSGDAAPSPIPPSLMATAHLSASPYQAQYAQNAYAYAHSVSLYPETEFYNPAAGQLAHPPFMPYALHYPYAMDPNALQDSSLRDY